jgi:hypothetical protein
MRRVYADHPVAVMLSAFNAPAYGDWAAANPGRVAGEGLGVVDGPVTGAPISQPALGVEPYAWWRLGLLGVACAVALGLIGLGWAVAMLRRWLRPAEVLAVAPAVGIAALVVVAVVADRLGVRLVGVGTAIGGGLLALAGARRGGTRSDGAGTDREAVVVSAHGDGVGASG